MKKTDSLLLIIDVQERLAPQMASTREVITNCSNLVAIAKKLNIPFLITEQYPKGLGPTMIDIREEVGEGYKYPEKLTFSCAKDEGIMKQIKSFKKKEIIIAGIETHICVLQTAIDLKDMGYEVFVVSDACSSRDDMQNVFGLHRMMNNGINVVTTEMTAFEWLEKAGSEEFKEISKKYLK